MASIHNGSDVSVFECSVCLELLCEPMQLPCLHVFCRKCLAGVVRQSRHCPLCRASISENFDPIAAPLHQPLEKILMRQCTVEYMQRMEDIALEVAHLVRLNISNEYEFLGFQSRPRHSWTVKIEVEPQPEACMPLGAALPDLIKHVRFALPPACRVLRCGSHVASETERLEKPPRYVEVSDGPFEVMATSPMSCTIPIVIFWHDWVRQPPLRLEHALDFCRNGGCWDYAVDLHAALTGNTTEDLSQVENSQRTHMSLETRNSDHGTLAPPLLGAATHECHHTRRKSLGVFSAGWAEMCRHLPKMRKLRLLA